MSPSTSTVLRVVSVIGMVTAVACSREPFPVTPTPVAGAAVTTVTGGNWSGQIVLSDGVSTAFNMTLIARGLGATTGARTQSQAMGTVDVSGNFATDTGLKGTVAGSLQGTLQNGTFQGTLTTAAPACSRGYTGPITESSVAWIPSGPVPAACPLTFSVQLPRDRGPDCQYSISLNRLTFAGSGGTGEVTVTTGATCAWSPESSSPWIQFADTTPRVGTGRASFTVMTGDPAAREGQIRIAGSNQTFIVTQGPGCTYSVSPSTTTFADLGGSSRVTVTAPDGCAWTARSAADWLTVAPTDGAGTAVLTLSAQPNRGVPRQATVSVGGQIINVSQGLGCEFTVTPTSATVPMGGGEGVLSIGGAAGGCTWTAQSEVPWLSLTPSSGTGDGRVSYVALANTGSPRQGVVRVGGQIVTISQGTCATPTTVSLSLGIVPSAGATGAATVSAAQGCPWTAASGVPWLTLSATSGTGPASIVVTVASNAVSAPRQGTLSIAGQTFTVNQAAAACVYTVNPSRLDVDIVQESFDTILVGTAPGCTWRLGVTAGISWLAFRPDDNTERSGPGSFLVAATSNVSDQGITGPPRTGTITVIGNQATATVTVNQAGITTPPAGRLITKAEVSRR